MSQIQGENISNLIFQILNCFWVVRRKMFFFTSDEVYYSRRFGKAISHYQGALKLCTKQIKEVVNSRIYDTYFRNYIIVYV